jgi:hypothetical protein
MLGALGRKIRGLTAASQAPMVSHSQFVDDILIMGEVTLKEIRAVKKVLKGFEKSPGQSINLENTMFFFVKTLCQDPKENS